MNLTSIGPSLPLSVRTPVVVEAKNAVESMMSGYGFKARQFIQFYLFSLETESFNLWKIVDQSETEEFLFIYLFSVDKKHFSLLPFFRSFQFLSMASCNIVMAMNRQLLWLRSDFNDFVSLFLLANWHGFQVSFLVVAQSKNLPENVKATTTTTKEWDTLLPDNALNGQESEKWKETE